MEINTQVELAFDYLQYTGANVFLTGKAGTGKTTFLRELRLRSPKRMIVLAPTGVAAINAGGVTIHSFFQLPFGPYVSGSEAKQTDQNAMVNRFSKTKIDIIRSLDLLVIDEISMVRADLLDAVSDVLCRFRDRNRPFGGVQLLMIGDLQQLAPVVKDEEWSLLKNNYASPFFFNSMALRETPYVSIELTHVYRQSDTEFVHLLNKVRDNCLDEVSLSILNSRYVPGFVSGDNDGYITLTTHNHQAQQLNNRKLEELETESYTFDAGISGTFPEYSFPTDEHLVLKEGAQVMFVQNDPAPEKRYYNGKIGRVTAVGSNMVTVMCEGDTEAIKVEQGEWTNTKYTIDPETKEITETVEGTFKQYPLKTAWAITIHKSQGLTFERAVIDAGAAFTHGQVYVALSRCKTLEGLVLSTPISRNAVISDTVVKSFTDYVGQHQPGQEELQEARRHYYLDLLIDLFDYKPVWRRMVAVTRIFGEHLNKLYPELAERWRNARELCHTEMADVGDKFKNQLSRFVLESGDYETDAAIKERINKGLDYFGHSLSECILPLIEEGMPEVDNKEIRKQLEEAFARLQQEIGVKQAVLKVCADGFSVKKYLEVKAKASIGDSKPKSKKSTEKAEVPADILHPILYKTLTVWRKAEADRLKYPAYTILHQKALLGICNLLPTTRKELLAIPGVGKKIIDRYGAKLLELVDEYRFAGE